MAEKISIGILSNIQNPQSKDIKIHEGLVQVDKIDDRSSVLKFFLTNISIPVSSLVLTYPEGYGPTVSTWETYLHQALSPNDDAVEIADFVDDEVVREVITTFSVLDFQFEDKDSKIFIFTTMRVEEPKDPIPLNRALIFRDRWGGGRIPTKVFFTVDGIRAVSSETTGTVNVYNGHFSEALSPWTRMSEYLGIGNLQEYKFSLDNRGKMIDYYLNSRGIDEFSWVESGDGKIAFAICKDPIRSLFIANKKAVRNTTQVESVKEYLNLSLNNLMLGEVVYLQAHANPPTTTVVGTINRLLDFHTELRKIADSFYQIQRMGYDRFDNQTSY